LKRPFHQLFRLASASLLGMLAADPARASGGGIPQTIDFYGMILHTMRLEEHWLPTVGALAALAIIVAMGLRYRSAVMAGGDEVVPDGRFSIRFMVDTILDFVMGIAKDNCGEHYYRYFGFLATLFLFILVSNLSGLVPGFEPATISMDTNVAMGLIVFFAYNYAGFREHGRGYIKQFLGPVALIAPLFFLIELVSHAARPLSLGLRLMANIYSDHTLVGVFTGLTYVVFPSLLMFFGLLVAVVQAFIFTLLTGIYISMAISHEH
jgi:F-type H+-transporting ATPase subunit a